MNAPDSPCLWTYSRLMEMTRPEWERDVTSRVAIIFITRDELKRLRAEKEIGYNTVFFFDNTPIETVVEVMGGADRITRVWFVLGYGWIVEEAV